MAVTADLSFRDLTEALSGLRRSGVPDSAPARTSLAGLLARHRPLGEREAAALLGVSGWKVRQWVCDGLLEPVTRDPLSVSAVSVAWAALVTRELAQFPDAARSALLRDSVVDRDRLLAAVLRGRDLHAAATAVDLTDTRLPR